MRSRHIHLATLDPIHNAGFDRWYNPVEKPLGFINVAGTMVTLLHGMGRQGGRTDTILKHTERLHKKKVLDFVSEIKLPTPLVNECFKEDARRDNNMALREMNHFLFLFEVQR